MELPITEQIKLDLSNIHRGTKSKELADKVKSIRMLSENIKQIRIAEILQVTEKTVYNWKQEFLSANNIEVFIAPNSGNYRGKLDGLKKTSL